MLQPRLPSRSPRLPLKQRPLPLRRQHRTSPRRPSGDDSGAAAAAEPAEEEPKPILLWRMGRSDHRPRHQRPNQRNRDGQRAVQTAPGEAAASEPASGRPRPDNRGRPGGGKPKFDRDRYKGPPKAAGEGSRQERRQDGKGDRGKNPKFQQKPREERPAQIDPLSPFAKLAALRDQLAPKK